MKKICFSFIILIFFSGCSTFKKATNLFKSEPLQVIDAHTHTFFSGQKQSAYTREEYFKEWEEAGVVGAIAHTSSTDMGYTDLKKQHVIHCAGVAKQVDVKRIEKGLKSGRYGCLKIYLGYISQYAYAPAYDPAYKLAEKYNVPVVFHTGDTSVKSAVLKYADPLTIDEVAVKYPKVKFVIAHCGNPWIQSAAEVAYKNDNVYLDGSAFLTGDLSEQSKEKIDTYVVQPLRWVFGYVENPKKLMYGTDWPVTKMKPYLDAFKQAIPKEHWKAVFHDNALEVFPALKKNLESN